MGTLSGQNSEIGALLPLSCGMEGAIDSPRLSGRGRKGNSAMRWALGIGMGRRLLAGFALLVGWASLAVAQGPRAPSPDLVFTVSNYPVEARAADAVAAKAKAMADGERAAFRSLMRRLLPVTAYARIRRIDPPRIAALLDGVSVRQERNSSTEYAANIDFTFNAKAVRDLLEREGLPYADQPARPIIVVPVWQAPQQGPQVVPSVMTAAEGTKAWTNAWRSLDLKHSLTPVDLQAPKGDVTTEAAKAFAGGNLSLFTKVSSTYGSERVVIAYAEPELGSKKLNVTLVGQDARGAIQWTRGYRIDMGDPSYTIESAAVISLGVIEGRWKAGIARGGSSDIVAASPRPEPQGSGWTGTVDPAQAPGPSTAPLAGGDRQTIAVEFNGMGQWTDISRKLSATPGLSDLDVIGLNQRGARVTARVTTSVPDLQRALQAQGLTLRASGSSWIVTAQP
jgi:hypothetical protein